ncbi:NAD(+) diphosphatase [Pseudoalteromonas fenneropenaei]|uniref:NAD(+) diphosphatase n=1 Tax=Pseudoalteromonas fenneropenaei TaxID=1737459 RepID=A0ABV7CPU8_9GAMM
MLYYAHLPLNRHSAERKDANWLLHKQSKNSLWLLVNNSQTLFKSGSPEIALLSYQQVQTLDLWQAVFLGAEEGQGYFALDVSSLDTELLAPLLHAVEFKDIRSYGPLVDLQKGSIAALARGLCHWHVTHRFCGRCGHANKPIEAGHARLCTNAECKHMTFPRTDPAVIMLVTKRFSDGIERCLLGRQASWPEGVYSTLAGFVDPGESLEQAVAREVLEEAGVAVSDVTYIASQPWPFPSSLMLGFFAKAESSDIYVDKDELDDAKWFSRAELNQFLEWGSELPGYKLTRKDSISRFLVEHWRKQEE